MDQDHKGKEGKESRVQEHRLALAGDRNFHSTGPRGEVGTRSIDTEHNSLKTTNFRKMRKMTMNMGERPVGGQRTMTQKGKRA
jgi:hypothetical protein